MSNYKHLNFNEYQKVLNKSQQYIETNVARSMKKDDDVDGDPLNKNQLISIILYTDFTELSTDFTKSFRKLNEFELLSQIKQRNQKYYHWSKILKTTTKYYGQYDLGGNGVLGALHGPLLRHEYGIEYTTI